MWAQSGSEAIEVRTRSLIEDAEEEIVLIVGQEALLTDDLVDSLNAVSNGVTVIVGAVTETIQARIRELMPDASVFVSGLDWLHEQGDGEHAASIGRLLMIDREMVLVSSHDPETGAEHSVFGQGFGNGFVVILRRLMATGLLTADDPSEE